ncbi:hypothetical protein PCCS19_10850 [Paenibacillus sp. CCS19]|uniref:hypothetical protein n=1 Tax=Paenibacillus sp. CCS19 TaxID=3158387 RepID=UPI00255FCE16|nr:hypothetical protein [Paenibacillus cellulosilyticus]GMK38031.1 hypothetical protein PCCS19_10850 [Paenibacillus cellulosilyticus]
MSTVKQLTTHLASSSVMLVLATILFIASNKQDQPKWISFPIFATLPALVVVIVCILSDLIREDHITIEGTLVEKLKITNGWKFRIRPVGEEHLRTFRMNEQFDDTFTKIELEETITVTYFRLTRGVYAVRKPDNGIEMIENVKD